MKKRGMGILLLLMLILIAPNVYSQIYLGTCDGYVDHVNGSMIEGATITVSVDGCSGGGCQSTDVSDSNFYYVVANLNIAPFGTVTVTGTKGTAYGVATGTVDQFMAGRVNVTLCDAPSNPVLNAVADTHDNSFISHAWTSGVDPYGDPTYDEFDLNGVIQVINSSVNVTGVNYQIHTWRVRTCNIACCSPWASDSYDVYNNPPPAPVLVPIPDQTSTEVNYDWSLVVDPDGDPVSYHFRLDGNPIVYNVLPDFNGTVTGGWHTWRVMACDDLGGCSPWSTDTFNIFNNAPTMPGLIGPEFTQQTEEDLAWDSGVDPNGDPTYDQFQFSDTDDFSNMIIRDDNVTGNETNVTVTGLTLFERYFWRVRTCDDKNACSQWNSTSFFTYECNGTGNVSCVAGERSCGVTYNAREKCSVIWECYQWGECRNGTQKRECKNIGTCAVPFVKTEYVDCFEEKCLVDADCSEGEICKNNICIPVIKERYVKEVPEETECKFPWYLAVGNGLLIIWIVFDWYRRFRRRRLTEKKKVFSRKKK